MLSRRKSRPPRRQSVSRETVTVEKLFAGAHCLGESVAMKVPKKELAMLPKSSFSEISGQVLLTVAVTLLVSVGSEFPILKHAQAQTDPLPSWNEGASKRAMTNFVAYVIRQGGPDFVPASERIATFDNDGTLWVEHPMYVQLAFVLDRVKAMRPPLRDGKANKLFKQDG